MGHVAIKSHVLSSVALPSVHLLISYPLPYADANRTPCPLD